MTESAKTKRYGLRMIERFAFYDDQKSHLFWDWPQGAIVDDPDQIALLESRGAPVERIEDPKLSTPTHPEILRS